MSVERVPMTPRGYERLVAELRHIKEVRRPENVKAIEEARAHGDLSENAEYHAAKEQQSFIQGRMEELESKITRAQVIDVTQQSGERVIFGATVEIREKKKKKVSRWRIVGSDEADATKGLISIDAPLARTLIGKEEGAVVKVKLPGGVREFEIESVEYVGDADAGE